MYENEKSSHFVSERVNTEENVVAKAFVFMTVALILTAASSYYTIDSGFYLSILNNQSLFWGLIIGELAVVFIASSMIRKNLAVPAAGLFIAYSIINGATLSIVFVMYDLGSVANIFVLTAVVFGAMAAIGLFTKKDLTSLGGICLMGLIAVIVLSVANIFFIKSNMFDLMITGVGLLIFIGLTAYDAQKIKKMVHENTIYSGNTIAMFGALQLYLDFINIFLRLLRLLGKRN